MNTLEDYLEEATKALNKFPMHEITGLFTHEHYNSLSKEPLHFFIFTEKVVEKGYQERYLCSSQLFWNRFSEYSDCPHFREYSIERLNKDYPTLDDWNKAITTFIKHTIMEKSFK